VNESEQSPPPPVCAVSDVALGTDIALYRFTRLPLIAGSTVAVGA
jgi:hypothetical protein